MRSAGTLDTFLSNNRFVRSSAIGSMGSGVDGIGVGVALSFGLALWTQFPIYHLVSVLM
jgi:hypothetical protein